MKMKTLTVSAAIVAVLPLLAAANTAENKAFVIEALENTLLAGDPEAADRYFATDYVQHNPDFANGIDAQKGVIAYLSGVEGFDADYVRVIADDDLVAIHGLYEGFGPTATIGFDVFRVADGKIVEHWDNLVPEAAPNPSGHTQIDGATEITDVDKTEANKALVTEFVTKALVDGEAIDFSDYIDPASYVQHNSMAADGLDGFGAFMEEMAAEGTVMTYNEVHEVIGEGSFVLTMSDGALGDEPQAFYDLFRVADGLIVEHWDVVAPMPAADAPHDGAGKF